MIHSMMLTSVFEQTISYPELNGAEFLDPLRKRLLFRSHHCGMKENDLLLGRFADHYIEQLDDRQLADFERLMEQNDVDILNWLTGKETPPVEFNNDVFLMIKQINKLN